MDARSHRTGKASGFLTNEDIREIYADGEAPVRDPEHGSSTNVDQLGLGPAKIDLRIGRMYKPGEPIDTRHRSLMLRSGEVALVETLEAIQLPADMLALMFPKSGALAQKGILITNFGHVDPGFDGHLTYTLVNISGRDFELRRKDSLACLMLYRLGRPAAPSWNRHAPTLDELATDSTMAMDFMDLKKRMDRRARNLVLHQLGRTLTPTLVASLLGTVIAAAMAVAATGGILLEAGTPKQHELDVRTALLEKKLTDLEKSMSTYQAKPTNESAGVSSKESR